MALDSRARPRVSGDYVEYLQRALATIHGGAARITQALGQSNPMGASQRVEFDEELVELALGEHHLARGRRGS
jgi:hypothetical protein